MRLEYGCVAAEGTLATIKDDLKSLCFELGIFSGVSDNTKALECVVRTRAWEGRKIAAIKEYKNITAKTLAECKRDIEFALNTLGY